MAGRVCHNVHVWMNSTNHEHGHSWISVHMTRPSQRRGPVELCMRVRLRSGANNHVLLADWRRRWLGRVDTLKPYVPSHDFAIYILPRDLGIKADAVSPVAALGTLVHIAPMADKVHDTKIATQYMTNCTTLIDPI